jgi:predicted nucleic acid-binding protein
VRFWDSSAIVPLLVREAGTAALIAEYEREPDQIVWWASPVECVSALARLEREGQLSVADLRTATHRLGELSFAWSEVAPTERVRQIAVRLLRVHALRAADASQLAAAIVAAEERPSSLAVVTLDERLGLAAEREGFAVVTPSS